MYTVGDTHSHMSPVGDDGGEEDLCHVRSGGRSVTHVPSGGWWRRRGSVSCTQWGTLTHICPQWGMVEEKRICVMYAVGDTHSHMSPVGDGGGEEDLCTQWGTLTHVPSGGWDSAMYAVGDAQ